MGVLGKIGAIFSGGVVETVERGADIVERWAPGAEKKHEMALDIDRVIQANTSAAYGYAAPGESKGWLNDLANGLNRLVRPVVTLGFFGGLFGFWPLPETGDIDPAVLAMIGTVLGFWFGGRALFKDLPAAIRYLRETRKE